MSKTRYIEIGHIYWGKLQKHLKNNTPPPEFEHLKNFEFGENDVLFVLVDDKRKPVLHRFGYAEESAPIESFISEKYNLNVISIFESWFIKSGQNSAYLYIRDQKTESPLALAALEEFRTTGKPNCFLLSFAWALYRSERADGVVTIIDKKYREMEMTIAGLLPPKLSKKCKWIFI